VTELNLIDIGELLVVGILASALTWAVVEGIVRLRAPSKTVRRLLPTIVAAALTLPGLPLALVWLTPVTWPELQRPEALVGVCVVAIFGSVACAGGAQWCHAIVRSAVEKIGDRAPDLLTRD
jgi:drug/metabolite transporter (DMT)-like permease